MRQIERVLRPRFRNVLWQIKRPILAQMNPHALAFYNRVLESAYKPNELIDVLREQRILYVAVPKAACSRIRGTLSALIGRDSISADKIHNRRVSGLRAPRHSLTDFHEIATDPQALRFSFVRNPYDRILSCWADQYRGKPLIPGDWYIDLYLKLKQDFEGALPAGADQTLSFADFARFASANAGRRVDMHWQLQSDILDIPGLTLNHVGKIEQFDLDFARVLDHAGVRGELRQSALQPIHSSGHRRTADYFTDALAASVYRAYERDFDTFGFPKKLPS
jgi:hypothetical protein